ncbi:MAG: orotate phosphoribosyltransferase [Candidatus Aenigmatarchaeota archaeon]
MRIDNPEALKKRLLELIRERALKKGEFVLSSGRKSNYYIDGKYITLDPEGAHLIGMIFLHTYADAEIDAVGGLTLGADPIVGAVVALSNNFSKPLRGFIVRKEEKGYGSRKFIEGPLFRGDRVIIIEDVITTGASSHKAICVAESEGAIVKGVFCIVDRQEGGRSFLEEKGYKVSAIFKRDDILY